MQTGVVQFCGIFIESSDIPEWCFFPCGESSNLA